MKNISLVRYSPSKHLSYLKKWLTNEKLMKGWGMPPFWEHKVQEWAEELDKVILMIRDDNLKKIVGFVNFYDWNKNRQVASRGTLIDPKYQNQGYGKAAIKNSNKYAFEKMKLKRIELYVDDENKISRHLTEKLGYKYDKYDPKKKRHYFYMDSK